MFLDKILKINRTISLRATLIIAFLFIGRITAFGGGGGVFCFSGGAASYQKKKKKNK